MKLHERLQWAKENLEPVDPQYTIFWEDPNDLDAPVRITIPSPEWLACALFGGILPPVDAYLNIQTDEKGNVSNGEIIHKEVIGPMTEEEAMEYLVQKDIPISVWIDKYSNRQRFKICKKSDIPNDRTFRNAWRLKNDKN